MCALVRMRTRANRLISPVMLVRRANPLRLALVASE